MGPRASLAQRAFALTALAAVLLMAFISGTLVQAALLVLLAVLLGVALVAFFGVATPLERKLAFRVALNATANASVEKRRWGAHALLGMTEQMTPGQFEGAAPKVLTLASDPDGEVRWLSAKIIEEASPLLAPPTCTQAFQVMLKLTTDDTPKTRSAAAMSMASALARADGRDSKAARDALERLLGDGEAAVRLWAMDAVVRAGPSLEAPDLAALSLAVLRFVTQSDAAMAWKAGRTVAAMARQFPPSFAERAALDLVALAERAGGGAALAALSLAAEVGVNVDGAAATTLVEQLVAQSEAGDGEPALQALRVAAVFSKGRRIEAGNATTQALARMAMAPDLPRRDSAMLCLAVIGAAAGAFGKELGGETAADVAEHLTAHFESPDGSMRRWARDLWPLAFALSGDASREALLDRLYKLHAHGDKNVRWAASASLTAVRGDLSEEQLAQSVIEVSRVLKHVDGDTKRLATVTLVSLFEVVPEAWRAEIAEALAAVAQDSDPVVASQAQDCLAALREIRNKEAKAAARATR